VSVQLAAERAACLPTFLSALGECAVLAKDLDDARVVCGDDDVAIKVRGPRYIGWAGLRLLGQRLRMNIIGTQY
jgi:hypothetical protein